MTELRVWAPRARHDVVAVVGADRRRVRMARGERGWFSVDVPDLEPGDDYAFVVDGRGPFPDPRSPHQPSGVHGPSRLVDHGAFEWTDGDWRGADVRDGVLYELHVGTFSPRGDFDGVVERLDHLVDLGVTAVELLPVVEFPGTRNWGYDGVALYAPHHAYGGPDGLKRLVDACHGRGLAVVLDVVYNHLGPEGNYLGAYGPYFTDFYSTPWGAAVNYDRADSDEVRAFALDNALMWLRDYHVDALRLDAVHAIIDTSATHLLEEMVQRVEDLAAEVGRPLTLIAESDQNDPRLCRSRDLGGYGLHAQWSDDFHHALHVALTGETSGYYEDFDGLSSLAASLRDGWVYTGGWSDHRRRRHGRAPEHISCRNLLGYAQNHDQVGNRAVGDRLSANVSDGRLRVAAALVLTAPFVPMLFQGEEWGTSAPFQYFTDHQDSELGRAVAQGRRSEFGAFGWEPDQVPDPQDPATFERSRLDWSELGQARHAALLDWYRDLVALRLGDPDLRAGDCPTTVEVDPAAGWLRFDRGRWSIAAHLGSAPVVVPVPAGQVVLASDQALPGRVEASGIELLPDTVVVVDTTA
ncbi:malto-oligosyltrehalose trehalohydrolase [Actinomarinicola tropica]|uniref:Malto-oligosyltrehalose trehalohydrolase n=1 Tax=Actinomarinicola tropica TaxID=2789776 RepID=A0A5Q2RMY4_9ACTN|nr:malto-oligosyltrehalose trehalohydrolase [Actinomarinicola tropica]QGG96302.1 malto-oligosyltrehalose trehalohydrolase [Actinomarinicola tropica]